MPFTPPEAFASLIASMIPSWVELPKVASSPLIEPTSPMRMLFSSAGAVCTGSCFAAGFSGVAGVSVFEGCVFFSQPAAARARSANTDTRFRRMANSLWSVRKDERF